MITLNGAPIVATEFPDKTSQVWKLPEQLIQNENQIVWTFESECELIRLVQLQYLVQHLKGQSSLVMPFLPYARQDKPVSNDSTFALRPFLGILRQLGFTTISAFDPHNESVVREYLDNFVAWSPEQAISQAIHATKPDLVCYPDAGAKARYASIVRHDYVHAIKVRNQTTGEIASIDISGNCRGKSLLIVDDICDGGMTFIRIAEALIAQHQVSQIALYVSHGLFSKGTEILRQAGIQRIFTQYGEIK